MQKMQEQDKPVLKKRMITHEQCVNCNFVAPLSLLFSTFVSIILSLYTLSSITLMILPRKTVKSDVTSNQKYR